MIKPNPALRPILPILMLILIVFVLALTGGHSEEEDSPDADGTVINMTEARPEEIVSEMATETEGEPGWLNFLFDGVPMVCVSDVNADRMRITVPIAILNGLDGKQLIIAMEANDRASLPGFHAAKLAA